MTPLQSYKTWLLSTTYLQTEAKRTRVTALDFSSLPDGVKSELAKAMNR